VRVLIGADFISVQDSGIGMSTDELAQIFQHTSAATAARARATGVGLTLVRRLSDRFGLADRTAQPARRRHPRRRFVSQALRRRSIASDRRVIIGRAHVRKAAMSVARSSAVFVLLLLGANAMNHAAIPVLSFTWCQA